MPDQQTTISQLPFANPLAGYEPTPVVQNGETVQSTPAAFAAFASALDVLAADASLAIGVNYGVRTSVTAIVLTLLPLSTFQPGERLSVRDLDYNALLNNITIGAAGSDAILLDLTSDVSITLNTNGAWIDLVVTEAGWRVCPIS